MGSPPCTPTQPGCSITRLLLKKLWTYCLPWKSPCRLITQLQLKTNSHIGAVFRAAPPPPGVTRLFLLIGLDKPRRDMLGIFLGRGRLRRSRLFQMLRLRRSPGMPNIGSLQGSGELEKLLALTENEIYEIIRKLEGPGGRWQSFSGKFIGAGGALKEGGKSPGRSRSQGRRGSGPEGQFLHQAVGEGQDEVPLLAGGVADAGAAHGLPAPDEELEAHEVVPQLHREPERPAVRGGRTVPGSANPLASPPTRCLPGLRPGRVG